MAGIILSLLATLLALGFAFHTDDPRMRREGHHYFRQQSRRSSMNRAQEHSAGEKLDDRDHPGPTGTSNC
jgi:hypothetical protein